MYQKCFCFIKDFIRSASEYNRQIIRVNSILTIKNMMISKYLRAFTLCKAKQPIQQIIFTIQILKILSQVQIKCLLFDIQLQQFDMDLNNDLDDDHRFSIQFLPFIQHKDSFSESENNLFTLQSNDQKESPIYNQFLQNQKLQQIQQSHCKPLYEEEITHGNFTNNISQSEILEESIKCHKRTSNNSLKPILTCLKRILLQFDDSFSGFFPKFMKPNQNKAKKIDFQYPLSFAQFHKISLNGSQVTIEYVFDRSRKQFTQLIQKLRNKGSQQQAKQTQKFVNQLYDAIKCKDYKERMSILFGGRKHSLKKLQEKRKQFLEFAGITS